MPTSRNALWVFFVVGVLLLSGCAQLRYRNPIAVSVVGVEPLPGEGLELRMLTKLRIQNPNDLPLDFNGISIQIDIQDKRFATGVSDVAGSVPRFGETIIAVPVSVSALRFASQIFGTMTGDHRGRLAYVMSGKLAGPVFDSISFKSTGELTLPEPAFRGE